MSGSRNVTVLDPGDLIEEVRRRPVVYENVVRDRTSVEEAWIDISQQLGSDAQTCKLKWLNLRDSYLRWRKCKCGNTSLTNHFQEYFELMGFLDSEVAREKDNDRLLKRNSKAENVCSPNPDAEMTHVDITTTPRAGFPFDFLKGSQTDAMNAGTRDSRLGDLDGDLHFLLSLLPLLKRLSHQENLDIRIEIQSAFRRKLFPENSSI